MSAGPYRTPAPASRPVLAWWQRVLVRMAPERWLFAHRWYRARVGGRWCYGGDEFLRPWAWRPVCGGRCPAEALVGSVILCACKAGDCRCEVYSNDATATATAGQPPELPPGRVVYWEPSGWIEPSLDEIRRIEAHNAAVRAMPASGTAEDYGRWASEFGIVDQARWLAARSKR